MLNKLLEQIACTPLAILPARLHAMVNDLRGLSLAEWRRRADEVGAAMNAPEQPLQSAMHPQEQSTGAGVAVISIRGHIRHRGGGGLFDMYFGGVSTQQIAAALRAALADPAAAAIVLDFDSFGGDVNGVPELAAEILASRGQKPIIASVNAFAASAAYWLASAADEIFITPSGEVGSIGVWTMHVDISTALESEGLDVTLISAGKFKTEGNPFEPLGEEARAAIQADVDALHDMFIKAVAKGRGVSTGTVRNGFGEGRMVLAAQAVAMGMADGVATLETVISRAASRRKGRARAEIVAPDAVASNPEELPLIQDAAAALDLLAAQEDLAPPPEAAPETAPAAELERRRARHDLTFG